MYLNSFHLLINPMERSLKYTYFQHSRTCIKPYSPACQLCIENEALLCWFSIL